MADDDQLPEISQDLNVPLPVLPDTSALVPYRTSSTVPGQAPVVTTGYGARARPPLMPPSGAAGVSDTSQMMRTAFENLPVDQALKVINAVQQSMGQRLFAKAVQTGTPIPQAFATYGRMMFAGQSPSGLVQSMQGNPPPQMTPYQQQEIALRRAADARAAAREARAEQPKPAKDMTEGERMRLALEAQNQMKLGTSELATDPSYQSRTNLAQKVLNRVMPKEPVAKPVPAIAPQPAAPAPPESTPVAPVTAAHTVVSPFKEGATIRNKKTGKLFKVTNGVPVEVKEEQASGG